MQNQAVRIEKIGDIVKLSLKPEVNIKTAIPQLANMISTRFKDGNYKIILDIEQIKFPSPSFIALLIEMTSQARRAGGDIKLINIGMSSKSNFATFNPMNYLSMDMEEAYALEDFGVLAAHKKPIRTNASPEDAAGKMDHTESSLPNQTRQSKSEQNFERSEFVKIEKQHSIVKKSEQRRSPAATPHGKNDTRQIKPAISDIQSKSFSVSPGPVTSHDKTSVGNNISDTKKSGDVDIIRNNKAKGYRLRVKSKNESLYKICDFVTKLALKAGIEEREVGKIKVTVYEACLNVIEHSYHSDPDEWIVVTVQIKKPELIITIQDWGESFKFDDKKIYDVEQAMHERKTGGFGLYIIRRSMDDVSYKTDPINGNRLILTKIIRTR